MIEPKHPKLPIKRPCELPELARASHYHQPEPEYGENLRLMRMIDETYPVFGSRQMARWLRRQGYAVNRKRVQRLMRLMGVEAVCRKPNLSRKHPSNPVFPYLLRRRVIDHLPGVLLGPTRCAVDVAGFQAIRVPVAFAENADAGEEEHAVVINPIHVTTSVSRESRAGTPRRGRIISGVERVEVGSASPRTR